MNYKSGNRPAGNSPGTPLVTQLRKGKVKEGWKIKKYNKGYKSVAYH